MSGKRSYVYCITNIKNGKMYVGKTVYPSRRWHAHKSCNIRSKLTNAIKKYGKNSFVFNILSEWRNESDAFDEEKRLIKKLDLIKHGYNSAPGGLGGCVTGSSPNKGKKLSIEHKRKLSLAHIGKKVSIQTRKKMSLSRSGKKHPMFGKKHSAVARTKMSIAHKGKKLSLEHRTNIGLAVSRRPEEIKKRISDSLKGRKHSHTCKKCGKKGHMQKTCKGNT